MQDEDGDRRRELASRLRQRLEADGWDAWRPDEGKVRPEDTLALELTYRELAELVGALSDALDRPHDRRDAARWREAWIALDERLRGARNVRAVLRDFGLLDAGRKRGALLKRLRIARDYCRLTRSGPFEESPERRRYLWDRETPPRRFGETNPGYFAAGESPYRNLPDDPNPPAMPGESVRTPVSTIEAVRIIRRWYDFPSDTAAREALLDARKALKANLDHPLVCRAFPPPYDHFEIPGEAALHGDTPE